MRPGEHDALFAQLLQRLQRNLRLLPDKPDETPEATLACLWALAGGQPLAVSQTAGFVPQLLDEAARTRLAELVERRLAGVPLVHLTGRQEFMGQVLLASPAALVPRRETELLGFAAARRLCSLPAERPLVLDICTGAGNIALGIAAQVPHARIIGADLSEEAIALARENARFVGREDVRFCSGDLLGPFAEPGFARAADMITCNPPYISTARVDGLPDEIGRHEPRLAFDGGPFGVRIIRRIINEAPGFLKAGGWLLFEIGAGQGTGVIRSLTADSRYDSIGTHVDANGVIRVIEARCAAQPGDQGA